MNTEALSQHIKKVIQDTFSINSDVQLTRPEAQFGDFSTNIAMQLAKSLGKNPRDIAETIARSLESLAVLQAVSVAGPGFINMRLNDVQLFDAARKAIPLPQLLVGKTIVMEYSDANAFKALHAGHLYTTLVGDAMSSILESAGAKVYRVNFGGDVGLHVARAMWAILQKLGGENPGGLVDIAEQDRAEWVTNCYVEGTAADEKDPDAKAAIIELNKRVYKIHQDNDKNSQFAQIYWTCRQWSYDGFENLYKQLKVHSFDKYYPESTISTPGLETVKQHIGTVYQKSDGAIVFHGEPYGLFTQVFINSEGLPTYAGKDVGLIYQKQRDYAPDISYIITDFTQKDHMAVVMKSIEQFAPELVKNTVHQTHGRIKFADGRKMSSRYGNVVMATDIMETTQKSAAKTGRKTNNDIILAAVRYSFLKNRIGSDTSYDPEESVSLEGNSGPYLQYALVRARSILAKVSGAGVAEGETLDEYERGLARQLNLYTDAFQAALDDYSPHHIANYLYELAQIFNRFYEHSKVAGDPRQALRQSLVVSYEKVLSHGLGLLGIPTLQKM